MALRNLGKVKGDPGKDSTITIVDPVTLAPGQSATAQNIGTSQNVILKLGIPQGPRGYPGESVQGPKGDRGMPGEDGKDGKAATIDIHGTTIVDNDEDVRVENVGSANAASLHFYQKRIPDPMAVDGEFIDDSENPVQSKVIKEALEAKADIDSIPTKTSDLSNDSGFISSSSVEVMIEDALQDAVLTANPVDDELSASSNNAVKNSVITAALNDKVGMNIEDILDENNTKTGERITFEDGNRSVSMLLRGEEVYETQFLTSITKNREPIIVASLPDVGEETKLYLVPVGDDNFSMHLWMDVAGEMKYVDVNGGGGATPDLSGYALKSDLNSYATKSELSGYATTSSLNSYAGKGDAIKSITRSGTTFTATRADNTTFTFTQQDDGATSSSFRVENFSNEYTIGSNVDANSVSLGENITGYKRIGIAGFAVTGKAHISEITPYSNSEGYLVSVVRDIDHGSSVSGTVAIRVLYVKQ